MGPQNPVADPPVSPGAQSSTDRRSGPLGLSFGPSVGPPSAAVCVCSALLIRSRCSERVEWVAEAHRAVQRGAAAAAARLLPPPTGRPCTHAAPQALSHYHHPTMVATRSSNGTAEIKRVPLFRVSTQVGGAACWAWSVRIPCAGGGGIDAFCPVVICPCLPPHCAQLIILTCNPRRSR